MIVRLAVLISGSGRTLQNFIDRIQTGTLPAQIEMVISSRPDVQGVERAKAAHLPCLVVPRRDYHNDAEFSHMVVKHFGSSPVDLVVLAGFLHLFVFPPKYRGRVMNIHPALLPNFGGAGFYGNRVHEEVIRSGVKETGCTVHFCDGRYDHGPIILQRRIPVRPDDTVETLSKRVFQEECDAYPEAIRLFAEGRIKIEGDRVIIR